MTEEQKRIEAERARLIMENLGWRMTKLEISKEAILICFEKEVKEEKTE